MSNSESHPGSFWHRCAGSTLRDRQNLRKVLGVYLAFAVAFAGVSQLIKREILPAGGISWLAVAVPVVLAVLVFRGYARFLREADELQRAIHREALAVGFGVGFLSLYIYRLAERLGAPVVDTADVSLFLILAFSMGLVRATWRYR